MTVDSSTMVATLSRKGVVKGCLGSNMEKLEALDSVGGDIKQCNLAILCYLYTQQDWNRFQGAIGTVDKMPRQSKGLLADKWVNKMSLLTKQQVMAFHQSLTQFSG